MLIQQQNELMVYIKQEFIGENRNLEINTMKQLIKNRIEIYNDIRFINSFHMKTPKEMNKEKRIKIKTINLYRLFRRTSHLQNKKGPQLRTFNKKTIKFIF